MGAITLRYDMAIPPSSTTTITRPLPSELTTLDNAYWGFFTGGTNNVVNSWFHGDTPSPQATDPGNDFINQNATFPAGIKTDEREIVHHCKPIPTWAKGLTVAITNKSPVNQATAFLSYGLT